MIDELYMVLDLLLASVLGFFVGLERKMRSKEAGIRTHTIVSFGAALMMIISINGFGGKGDPARLAAQIVSGVSFLGAGIIVYRKHEVKGLTTAAGVWSTAGVGMACGARLYLVAILGCLLLIALQFVFHAPIKLFAPRRYYTLRIVFEEKNTEREEIKKLFKINHFVHLFVERKEEKLVYRATINTAHEFSSTVLDGIMKSYPFILAIERGDDNT